MAQSFTNEHRRVTLPDKGISPVQTGLLELEEYLIFSVSTVRRVVGTQI